MRAIALSCLGVLLTVPASAAYPTPAEAGFHHCALIYEAKERGANELTPYVATETGWLFDAFLFLCYTTKSGVGTSNGQTRRADWVEQLDVWLASGRDLKALDGAIEIAQQRLGPAPPRQIIFAIPYPNPEVVDFGDVDGDARSEDLSTEQGQRVVAQWYVTEAIRRFEMAGLRHLRLWGLYWMKEWVGEPDPTIIGRYASLIHSVGKRFLWIPAYRAEGWDRWRELGFDVAILQPNYSLLCTHGGSIRRNRLDVTAELAREAGMGVEIELPLDLPRLASGPRVFRHYLRDGAPDRCGYQAAATAYYLATSRVEELSASKSPTQRGLYDDLAAYVQNRVIAEPDEQTEWQVGGRAAPWLGDHVRQRGRPLTVAEAPVKASLYDSIDVFLDEPGQAWEGTVVAEGVVKGRWQPLGWAFRSTKRTQDGRHQVVTVPVSGRISRLRVRLQGGGKSPRVSEITPQRPLLREQWGPLALRAPYRFLPEPTAVYPDSGGELTDGVIPSTGYRSGQTVGWMRTPATISFDLGEARELTRAEVYLQGGGGSGVNWPAQAVLLGTRDAPPPPGLTDLGPLPPDLVAISPALVVVDRKRGDNYLDGHLTFALPVGTRARYVTLLLEPVWWLMVSEVRIFSGDSNVVAAQPYRLQPPPTPPRPPGDLYYTDNGVHLTDGLAPGLVADHVTGWHDGKERVVEVDLRRRCQLGQVVTWAVTGIPASIYLPESVTVDCSDEGEDWRPLGVARPPGGPVSDWTAVPCPLVTHRAVARYLRITVRPTKGWCMLSEVEVFGEMVSD